MNDEQMSKIADGCEKCARCGTPILPGQRSSSDHWAETCGPGGRATAHPVQHESPEDCVDALLAVVRGEPVWRGRESEILRAAHGPLRDYDCITGKVFRSDR